MTQDPQDQTHTDAAVSPSNTDVPVFPNPDKLYNELMWKIEPELTSDAVETLSEKYKGETEEQAEIRAERYNQAYEKFQKALFAYFDKLNTKIREYGRQAIASLEKIEREEEEEAMKQMETDMEQV